MPHFIDQGTMSAPDAIKDEPMEDAALPTVPSVTNGDGDAAEGGSTAKQEVKLEELFADVGSDDEVVHIGESRSSRSMKTQPTPKVEIQVRATPPSSPGRVKKSPRATREKR